MNDLRRVLDPAASPADTSHNSDAARQRVKRTPHGQVYLPLTRNAPFCGAAPWVGLTDLTLSCAAGRACRSRSGAAVAAIKLKQRDATCNRCDAAALATPQAARLPGRSRAAPASARGAWARAADD